MAKTSPAKGTMETPSNQGSASEGAYGKSQHSYGDLPSQPNVQEWPSYTGMPHRTGSATKSTGSKKSG